MPTRFTIAIPTHNRRETVLLAVRSALTQTRPPEQVIVLCDGCDDGTAEAVRALGSSLTEAVELPKGPGYAYGHRNRAVELAEGDVMLWLADDDLLMPDHLDRIGPLWDRGCFDLVQSDGVVIRPDDSLEWFCSDWSVPQGRARLAATNTNPMAAVSVRVDVVRAVDGWDDTVPRAGDWDLWRRIVEHGARATRSPEPTVLHFRATGREQPWPERVRQNTAWLERIGDPEQSAELRDALVRARSLWEADLIERLSGAEVTAATARLERDTAGYRAAQLGNRLAHAEAQAAAHAETLSRIYAGRWWRLRGGLMWLRASVRRLGRR